MTNSSEVRWFCIEHVLHGGLFEDGNTDVAGQNGMRFAGFRALRGI